MNTKIESLFHVYLESQILHIPFTNSQRSVSDDLTAGTVDAYNIVYGKVSLCCRTGPQG
jgi:hypothetical protein